ncbi:MAG: hypothetical protein NTY26_15460, partial [Burkholderiales bacterium]|nr:hypothetical protein [Burkholderiales bacterium]
HAWHLLTPPVERADMEVHTLVGRSAQRHQGGAQRAGDSRGAECAAGLIPHTRWHGSPFARG